MGSLIQCVPEKRCPAPTDISKWYALATLSRHERVVASQLESQGVTTFFPTFTTIHRWSDRRKKIDLPFFAGYIFVHALLSPEVRRSVWHSRGTVGFVAMGGQPIPIPDEQIESVKKLVNNEVPCLWHPFLKIGQRVRIRSGVLTGVEGILLRFNGEKRLVVSIDAVARSLELHIEGYDVEPLAN